MTLASSKVVIQDPSPYFYPIPGPPAISIPGFCHWLPIPAPTIKQKLQLLGLRHALSLPQRALPSSSQLLSADRGWVRMLYRLNLYRMKGNIYGNWTVEWDNQPLKYWGVLALGAVSDPCGWSVTCTHWAVWSRCRESGTLKGTKPGREQMGPLGQS